MLVRNIIARQLSQLRGTIVAHNAPFARSSAIRAGLFQGNHLVNARDYATKPAATKTTKAKATTKSTRGTKATTAKAKGKTTRGAAATATKKKAAAATKKKTTVKKKKAVPKKKPAVRRKLSEKGLEEKVKQAEREKVKAYVAKALQAPRPGPPFSAWSLYSQETRIPGANATAHMKDASNNYKTLPAAEREKLNERVIELKAVYKVKYDKWVISHTPMQIKEANTARGYLRRLKQSGSKIQFRSNDLQSIKDERQITGGRSAAIFYIQDRITSGAFTGIANTEAISLIHKEFANMSAAERKKYEDLSKADRERYLKDYKKIYGIEAPSAIVARTA